MIQYTSRDQMPADPVTRAIQKIRQDRRRIASLPPEQALSAILDHPTPVPLIHSFPEEELKFLLHDIGVEDSLEILSMASDSQWQYLLDADIWQKDRIRLPDLDHWIGFLSLADPDRLSRWLSGSQQNLFLYYLNRRMRVLIREHDQDPAELGNDLITWDDVLYFQFLKNPPAVFEEDEEQATDGIIGTAHDYSPDSEPGSKSDSEVEKEWEGVLELILRRIAEIDLRLFQSLLLGSDTLISSEMEEELYRLRTMRMSEKGFQPREEAIAIYQPLPPARLQRRRLGDAGETSGPDGIDEYPVPWSAGRAMDGAGLLGGAFAVIGPGAETDALYRELAGLGNLLIAADERRIQERGDLAEIISKASGFIELGIHALSEMPSEKPTPENAAESIRKYSLPDLFRLGFSRVMNLKWRAESWRKSAWYETQGLALTFWDEEWVGVLGGLLLQRPKYYDPDRPGEGFYREFAVEEDLRYVESELDALMAADRLLGDMGLSLSREGKILVKEQLVTWKNLLLTFWARHMLKLPEGLLALDMVNFQRFHEWLWTAENDGIWQLRSDVEENFLAWIADSCGIEMEDISEPYRKLFHRLFEELAEEFRYVPPDQMDIRYIHMFLVA